MFSSLLKKQMMRAGFLLLVSSFLLPFSAEAAPIEKVDVSLSAVGGDLPPAVEKRVVSSISSIGNRVLVGKEESLFSLNSSAYNKVLADIINRVVIGYVVSDLTVSYGRDTALHVTLQPVGQIIRHVDTEIDYGGLTPEAAHYVAADTADVPALMDNLLIGLPVDSVGWAESVSQSAGRDLLSQILPEFQANFEVESGENTKVKIYLIPQGKIVRSSRLTFEKTTIPRLLMLRAAEETETALSALRGLPVDFVTRHSGKISSDMNDILKKDSFIEKYGIATDTTLISGETAELRVNALTDHWVIRTEVWLDAGRDGDKNTAVEGMLGHYIGRHSTVFGEARFYPGPMDWNVYGGFSHQFGSFMDLGYKYDFVDNANHIFGNVPIGNKFSLRYDRDFKKRENEFGFSYKIHNYITLEYVYNDEDGKWLRLIANL
ncbi:Tat pathway signal sequence [uncultured Dialister sp.]|uniref:Tat pathway signal sequence n=1 Tax=uncultured Dialister sp. TaxID=278064 RepID=UPI00266FBD43|nr:Tat pathway signal sequence [uncultured Dialister sp.]